MEDKNIIESAIKLVKISREKVKLVDYALASAAIAACAAVVTLFLGSGKNAIVIFSYTLIGIMLLIVLSYLLKSKSRILYYLGYMLVTTVCACFCAIIIAGTYVIISDSSSRLVTILGLAPIQREVRKITPISPIKISDVFKTENHHCSGKEYSCEKRPTYTPYTFTLKIPSAPAKKVWNIKSSTIECIAGACEWSEIIDKPFISTSGEEVQTRIGVWGTTTSWKMVAELELIEQ